MRNTNFGLLIIVVRLVLFPAAIGATEHAVFKDMTAPGLFEDRSPLIEIPDFSTSYTEQLYEVYLYGAPRGEATQEGTFDDAQGMPSWQGWTTRDLTESPPRWRAGHELGKSVADHCASSHHQGTGTPVDYIGYGNYWDDRLVLTIDTENETISSVIGSSNTCELTIQFLFSEGFADDGSDQMDIETYNSQLPRKWEFIDSIKYGSDGGAIGKDYGSANSTNWCLWDNTTTVSRIQLFEGRYIKVRLRVLTGQQFSDEDGLWDSGGRGAISVDDIVVKINGYTVSLADWEPLYPGDLVENSDGDISSVNNGSDIGVEKGWEVTKASYAGDFAKWIVDFQDSRECDPNYSTQIGFINRGGGYPVNVRNATPEMNYLKPSIAAYDEHDYGGNGDNVLPWSAWEQLSGVYWDYDTKLFHNEIFSPEIEWEVPGDPAGRAWGLKINFSAWEHYVPGFKFVYNYKIRYKEAGNMWSKWHVSRNMGNATVPAYRHYELDATWAIVNAGDIEKIQIGFEVRQIGDSIDGTPAPLFDNISLMKYSYPGPMLYVFRSSLPNDNFPNDHTTSADISSPVRFDAAFDVNFCQPFYDAGGGCDGNELVLPADDIVIGVKSLTGDVTSPPVMQIAHNQNPRFHSERSIGLGEMSGEIVSGPIPDPLGWQTYVYHIDGELIHDDAATSIQYYSFDLPDGFKHVNSGGSEFDENGLLFAGDVLHFVFIVVDASGWNSIPPADNLQGFTAFHEEYSYYHQEFTMRCLPTIAANDVQPRILLWNDYGYGRDTVPTNVYISTMNNLGYQLGVDYDFYTTRDAPNPWSNSLGIHNPKFLYGYDTIIYLSGPTNYNNLSSGSG